MSPLARACRWVTVAVAVGLLTACSGGRSAGHEAHPTATATATVAAARVTASPTSSPAVVRVRASLVHFRSPTGNIGCELRPTTAACDLQQRQWKLPRRPATCHFDYGFGVQVDRGAGTLSCASDTVLDVRAPVLAYGHGMQSGTLRCVSEKSGVRCENLATHHGFAVSRSSYKLF